MSKNAPPVASARMAGPEDLAALLALYAQLHEEAPPALDAAQEAFAQILAQAGHHVILVEWENKAVAACELILVPNLTRGRRPYALIENLVTDAGHRRRGFGRMALQKAAERAIMENCYKIMLMTSRADAGTLAFYRGCGFDDRDKTAFVRRLQ